MSKRDLIAINDLSNQEIEEIFSLADSMESSGRVGSDREIWIGRIMATLFYEPSTRTRLSFESAMQRLGGSVISCPDMRLSSGAKGEIISDTARIVSNYADLLVVRHKWDGAVRVMAENAEVPVINAGDGSHEHPTQTLCDLYTLKKEKGKIKDLTVVICGDLKHGRTIHSLVYALARFGVHVVILAAKGMELPQYVIERLNTQYHYCLVPVASDDLHAVVKETDAVYLTPNQPHQLALFTEKDLSLRSHLGNIVTNMKFDAFYVTRQQKERVFGDEDQLKVEYPRIGDEFLKEKRFKDAVIMHPLPRVDELSQVIDSDRRGIYFKQAAYGVPIRMALLQFLFPIKRVHKIKEVRNDVLVYESPVQADSQCSNLNCVTRTESKSSRPRYEVNFVGLGVGLMVHCIYCDHQLRITCMGHLRSKRYCLYDASLIEIFKEWMESKELMIFVSLKQAEELGFEPYKIGPQRILMNEGEIREAIHRMANQIVTESPQQGRPLILGIKTKGVLIARRIAENMAQVLNQNVEVGEIEIYGTGGYELQMDSRLPSESQFLEIKDRPLILVDDVIHTGRTIKNALSIIFKFGRPRSVRLAVLIDRGHRQIPFKANVIGKHIPSSQRERVRVKLREVEKDERDKVVIYSMIHPKISFNGRSVV